MTAPVARHRTAMVRASLSRPIATARGDGLIPAGGTVFDYGCGRGDDLRLLAAAGVLASGWDPAFSPDTSLQVADVVNLGYVINVIENAAERAEAIRRAWKLTRRVLIVSARLTWEVRNLPARQLSDGLLTSTNTFQKFYEQAELSKWIADTLKVQPLAAAPGIFYVFRDSGDAQAFLAERVHTYRPRIMLDPHAAFRMHEQVLRPIVEFMTEHVRPPQLDELADADLEAVRTSLGSLTTAVRTVRSALPQDFWQAAERQRRAELLIYTALSRFHGRPQFRELGTTLARDVRALFASYRSACGQADRLLMAAGDPVRTYMSARLSDRQADANSAIHTSICDESPVSDSAGLRRLRASPGRLGRGRQHDQAFRRAATSVVPQLSQI